MLRLHYQFEAKYGVKLSMFHFTFERIATKSRLAYIFEHLFIDLRSTYLRLEITSEYTNLPQDMKTFVSNLGLGMICGYFTLQKCVFRFLKFLLSV